MPPLSEDEGSIVEEDEIEESSKKASKRKAAKISEIEPTGNEELVVVEDEDVEDDEDEDEDDEDLEEDVYIVETIKSHLLGDDGEIRFHVKWEGYDKKSDMTWEPEANLTGSASKILNDYYDSVGGRDFVVAGFKAQKEAAKPKKRGRQSTGTSTPSTKTNGKKRKTDSHPTSASPPASVANNEWKPPFGSWEEDVEAIDACEGVEGEVVVFLQWYNGHKTQHPLKMVYSRCPQKMLKFYESHLVFKKGSGSAKENGD